VDPGSASFSSTFALTDTDIHVQVKYCQMEQTLIGKETAMHYTVRRPARMLTISCILKVRGGGWGVVEVFRLSVTYSADLTVASCEQCSIDVLWVVGLLFHDVTGSDQPSSCQRYIMQLSDSCHTLVLELPIS
jgi:hypothetical protein